jgi:hypothetical protein
MTPDQHRTAKAVLKLLVEAEPRPAHHGPGWTVTVERRIRNERWPDVCALVAEHPELDPQTLADMASPTVASAPAGGNFQTDPTPPPLEPWTGPDDDPTAGPYVADPTEKLAAAHQALAAARKPPMGDPPISLRGAVA